MKTKGFPPVSEDLLKALEALFPNRLPDHLITGDAFINSKIGEQNVIRFLRMKFEEQNKNILEGT
ncbi:hypothetical protein HJJEPNFP_00025 [Ralstonia phage BOESR1]|uniref:Uncharacterized protein n=1 Tax=Ralstonia phage BOESR1 TaxID=3034917 RepID=A0AA50IHC3_9CAUD|nr:hypothetical protein HJJEPNFP_00025 [Ralstonia phage BOESR1]WLW40603.1 hypothetical protein HIBIKMCM_00036 [Ralstonia phage BOESR1]